jgi:hypothetical protein
MLARRFRRRRRPGGVDLAGDLTILWLVAGILLPVELRLRFLRPVSLPTLLVVLVGGGVVLIVWGWAIGVVGGGDGARRDRRPPWPQPTTPVDSRHGTACLRRGRRGGSNGAHDAAGWAPHRRHRPEGRPPR